MSNAETTSGISERPEMPTVSPGGSLLELYRAMARIRACEESFVDPIASGEIRCPVHLCSGQEAVAVGVCSALTLRDYVFGTHRSHGHYLAKGGDLRRLVAEVYCRDTGCARGRGGSMHVVDPDVGMLGAAPIVAGTISLAVGAALASSVRGDGRVAVAFFGDGAVGEGVLYESMNFAALRRLPVLFVCENNLYSTHLRINDCRVHEDIHAIAIPLGVEAVIVDGNDLLQINSAAEAAVKRLRSGLGPVFMECKTYRLRGHVGPDDNIQGTRTDIRPAGELETWRKRDPLAAFRARLLARAAVSADELAEVDAQVASEIEEAHRLARASAFPDGNALGMHVFAKRAPGGAKP